MNRFKQKQQSQVFLLLLNPALGSSWKIFVCKLSAFKNTDTWCQLNQSLYNCPAKQQTKRITLFSNCLVIINQTQGNYSYWECLAQLHMHTSGFYGRTIPVFQLLSWGIKCSVAYQESPEREGILFVGLFYFIWPTKLSATCFICIYVWTLMIMWAVTPKAAFSSAHKKLKGCNLI